MKIGHLLYISFVCIILGYHDWHMIKATYVSARLGVYGIMLLYAFIVALFTTMIISLAAMTIKRCIDWNEKE